MIAVTECGASPSGLLTRVVENTIMVTRPERVHTNMVNNLPNTLHTDMATNMVT